jgi:hypothetical protein
VGRAVAAVARRLSAIYGLDLDLRAERFVVAPETARRLLPPSSPRSGLVVVEEGDGLSLGLYIDPRDLRDPGTIVEETSHLLCLVWHALQDRSVSRLILELQGEVDRYVVSRLAGRDGFRHFRGFTWGAWMDADAQDRYQTAHCAAHRYCRSLARRFPRRSDTPALLSELRDFYRASPQAKLRTAAARPS